MTYEIYNVYIHVRLASVFYVHMSRVWDNSTVRLVPVLQRAAIPGQLKSVNKSNVHVSGAPDGGRPGAWGSPSPPPNDCRRATFQERTASKSLQIDQNSQQYKIFSIKRSF